MSTILKNLRKSAAVLVVAGALAPQFAMAHGGGGGMGGGRSMGSRMSTPSYANRNYTAKKVNTTTLTQNTSQGSFLNKFNKQSNISSKLQPIGTTGNNAPTNGGNPPSGGGGNPPTAINKLPVNTTVYGNKPVSTTTVPTAISKIPVNTTVYGKLPNGTTTSPTQPTCPSGNCYGGFGGLFPIGYGLGGFGGYGYGGGYGGGVSAPVASGPMASATVSDPGVVPASYAATDSQPAASAIPTTAATPSADLVVEDLQMAQPATLVAGPAYRVTFRNQGSAAAEAFRVGIFAALDGKLTDSHAVVDVSGLEAGKSAEVTLRLPQSAVTMVSTAGHNGFDKLAVMVDVDQRVQESDKTNNAAVLDRASLEAAR